MWILLVVCVSFQIYIFDSVAFSKQWHSSLKDCELTLASWWVQGRFSEG